MASRNSASFPAAAVTSISSSRAANRASTAKTPAPTACSSTARAGSCAANRSLRRVTRIDLDGTLTVLTDNFDGKKYNQPNDLTIDSKGRIYFSDPRYGSRDDMQINERRRRNHRGRLPHRHRRQGRPRHRPRSRPSQRRARVRGRQNLFVADNNNNTTGVVRAALALRPERRHVDRNSKKKLYDWGKGRGPDGVKQDQKGRLYVAGGLNKPNPPPSRRRT